MRKILFTICTLLALPFALKAEEFDIADNNIQTIYATLCENIRPEESKSATRARASDMACYKALENISALSNIKEKYDDHDFKVLVYSLIDNYLEDLTVRTTSQDNTQICIELTGYLNKSNIETAIQEIAKEHEEKYPEELMIEKEALTQPSPNNLPPKPDIKISNEIAMEHIFDETLEEEVKTKTNTSTGVPNIFIERTNFFNNTSTNAFHADIAQIVNAETTTNITSSLSDADYIIKSRVLRAKVEPLNKKTSRMQMVVAVELEDVKQKTSTKEHQNRFILFEAGENEQSVAANLLKKLLCKATELIVSKLQNEISDSNSMITPQASNYKSTTN